MKTKVFLWAILAIVLSFSGCTKDEENLSLSQKELLDETISKEQTGLDGDISADREESVQAIIRSLDLSMRGLPTNVNEIIVSPTGTISPNGETRVVIASGSFTSVFLVKVQDLGFGTDLASGSITGTGFMGSTTLAIPAYEAPASTGTRVIGFFYWGTTNQWELFHYETQAPNGTQNPFSVIPLDQQSSYPANGNSYTFTIDVNKAWQATILSDPGNVLSSIITTSGNAGIQSFMFRTQTAKTDGIAVVRFTSGLEYQDIYIYCTASGGFIKTPNLAGCYEADGSDYSFDLYSDHSWTATVISGKEFMLGIFNPSGGPGYCNFKFTSRFSKVDGSTIISFQSRETGETQLVEVKFKKCGFYVDFITPYWTIAATPPKTGLQLLVVHARATRGFILEVESDPSGIVYSVENNILPNSNKYDNMYEEYPATFSPVVWVYPKKRGTFTLKFIPTFYTTGPTGEAPIYKTITFTGF